MCLQISIPGHVKGQEDDEEAKVTEPASNEKNDETDSSSVASPPVSIPSKINLINLLYNSVVSL